MNLNDWLTIKQCATRAEVTAQAIHALANRGTLANTYVGRTRLIGRNSFNDWLAQRDQNPRSRSGARAPRDVDGYTPGDLEALGQRTFPHLAEQPPLDVDGDWSGVYAPVLSTEARRLYDMSPIGQRELRDAARQLQRRGEI